MSLSNLKSKIGNVWVGLTPGQRRIITLGGIFLAAALMFMYAAPERKGKKVSSRESTYEFQQPDMAGEIMAEKLQDNLMAQRAQMNEMQQRMNQIESTLNKTESNRRQSTPRPSRDSGRDISEGALMRWIKPSVNRTWCRGKRFHTLPHRNLSCRTSPHRLYPASNPRISSRRKTLGTEAQADKSPPRNLGRRHGALGCCPGPRPLPSRNRAKTQRMPSMCPLPPLFLCSC